MKISSLLAFIAVTPSIFAQESAPPSFDRARYDATMAKSPFALATKTVAEVVEAPKVDPFKDMFVEGVSKLEGQDYISIRRLSTGAGSESDYIHLLGTQPGPEGLRAVKINWHDAPAKTTVTVKKGSEQGEIKFNQAQIQAPPPGGNQNGGAPNANGQRPTDNNAGRIRNRNQNPQQPGVSVNNIPQPGFSGQSNGAQPTSLPSITPTLNNQNPAATAAPAGNPQGGSNESSGRRRIRTINNR